MTPEALSSISAVLLSLHFSGIYPELAKDSPASPPGSVVDPQKLHT